MMLDRAPVLSILNSRPSLLEGPSLLHDLVRTSSDAQSAAIDFFEENGNRKIVSYELLHTLSDNLAAKIHHELDRLENASAVIPVLLPQSPELYITLLAILKAGGAFCPLSLDTPDERLDFILQDIKADLLITTSAHGTKVSSRLGVRYLLVDEELSTDKTHARPPTTCDRANPLAYVLYTSGSTGLPKAVSVSHRAVSQSLLAHDKHIPMFSRFLQFAAPTFDVSIFEIFFPLFRGKTIVGCSRSRMLDDLPGIIQSLDADAAELTPTVIHNLLRGRASVPGLRLLLTIGEMLTESIVKEFGGDDSKESILWGMYGPTEAAIHCTLQPSFQCASKPGNIGFPLSTVSTFVAAPVPDGGCASDIKLLPLAEVGELVIGGPQVAEGYLNRPDITDAAFIRHAEYGYLYRTGDKARLHQDGTLECLGRIVTGQVKVRGQRVELGEIEQLVSSKVDTCRAAVALIVDDDLVLFVSSTEMEGSIKDDILNLCRNWLPAYMVPADVILYQQMPQSSSGKIDKGSLQAEYLHKKETTQISSHAESDPASRPILRIIQDALGRQITSKTPLASVGLDSLRSIRVASLLRETGYHVSAIDVLSAVDLEQLSTVCRERSDNTELDDQSSPFTSPDLDLKHFPELKTFAPEIADLIPCTPLQEAFLTETAARTSAYCNWIEMELSEAWSFAEIRSHLEALVDKNEVLRSGFFLAPSGDRSFLQVIWKKLDNSQFMDVTTFTRTFSLSSGHSFLRPFMIQINAHLQRPRILFQIHHAIYDGWSFDRLLQDFKDMVNRNNLRSRPQYRDVVNYYARSREGTLHGTAKEYWTRILSGYTPVPLPNFNGKLTRDGDLRSLSGRSEIDVGLLNKRVSELQIGPQVFYQSALALLIGSYLGTNDAVIGIVTSGRTIAVTGIEEIVGPCIASLPFRLVWSPHSSVQSILTDTQRLNRAMLEHVTLPLRDITRLCEIHPGQRLFDVLFVWQESLFTTTTGPLPLKIVDSADDLEFKLTVEFQPNSDHVSFRVTYDPAIIPEGQVRILCRQVDELVSFFIHHTSASIEQRNEGFSKETLSVSNAIPETLTIRHGPAFAVQHWADKCPDNVALAFSSLVNGNLEQRTLTYESLNRSANRVAHALRAHGVVGDELVVVIVEKSVTLYTSILAVLKTGAGYLPITPDTPPDRVARIISEARVRVCISGNLSSDMLGSNGNIRVMNVEEMDFSQYPDHNVEIDYEGSHLAYAVFTSGSTGVPKGVLVTQDNLMSNLQVLHDLYPTDQDSKLLQACSQAFDVSVFEIFFAWYAGMCLCSATKDDMFYNFEGIIDEMKITHLSLTPTVAALVNPSKVPTVKFLVTAGEAVTEHVRRLWAGHGLHQGYGPSETTNICTVRPSVSTDDLINNIGAAFKNTSTFVLEPESTQMVPRGGVGELCFGGAQVFRGYLNMPGLNARKIINHPQFGRIYRSGDMGRLLPDDSLLFTGRADDQVKVRGQRVELGEINTLVLDHDDIEDCVTLLADSNGTQKLLTFWVPGSGSSTTTITKVFEILPVDQHSQIISGVFEVLLSALPRYMIPTNLIPISRIPYTPQTKVDKRLLISSFQRLSNDYLEKVAFTSTSATDSEDLSIHEQTIAEALARTIQVPVADVRRGSSFFSLGLDSISAIRFSNLLRDLGLGSLSVSDIMKNPTVSRLSKLLDAVQPVPQDGTNNSVARLKEAMQKETIANIRAEFAKRKEMIEKILPCTPLQEAMLSGSASATESSYCNTMVFRVIGDVDRLRACWVQMVDRHEIFRTRFIPTDDSEYPFLQVISSLQRPALETISGEQGIESRMNDTISKLLRERQPPYQIAFCNTKTVTKVVFGCHHALYDGMAIATLLHEIETLYKDEKLPPPVPFDRYLQHMVTQDIPAADRYWNMLFDGCELNFFPVLTGKSKRETTTFMSITTDIKLPLDEIQRSCLSASVPLLAMMQSVWAKLLHFYLGVEDLCFGNVVSGRTLPEKELERLVAPCFNTLPVRIRLDPKTSNSTLAQQLRDLNIEAMPFQLTPLRRIQARSRKEGGRLFDTLFILQQPSEPLDESIWRLEKDLGAMDVPLVCEVSQHSTQNVLRLTLHYHTSLLFAEDAEVLVENFQQALESSVRFPHSAAGATTRYPLPLLSRSSSKYQSLKPVNGPFLHSAFEKQSELRPQSTALSFLHDDGTTTVWSYETLNDKANRIAHSLLEHGISPEDVIPIHVEKCPNFYAAVLGVLKSGAAFAPFHPELPPTRKEYMLGEIQPRLLLHSSNIDLDWVHGVPILTVDSILQSSTATGNPHVSNLVATNLAYCLYTSGSTGTPKAVAMEHKAPIQTIEASRSIVPWTPSSRLLQYAATTFDMCYYDIFLTWSLGFTLCSATQNALLNDLCKCINALEVDLLDLTPSVAVSITRTEVPRVTWLYCIGEPMIPEIIKEWEGSCVNSYGPTEAAFCTTIFPVSSSFKSSVIGKPFPTTCFAVVAKDGVNIVPTSGVGELYIGGSQLARGYFGRPELTNDKFVQLEGQRFYKSGDMVRIMHDGNFEFLGRADDQVKIRGLRVELGEINKVLEGTEETIRSVSTQILKKDQDAHTQLIAFLEVSGISDENSAGKLRMACKRRATEQLPAYMIPQFFIFLDRIPKNMAGKIDRNALTQIFRDSGNAEKDEEAENAKSHQWSKIENDIRDTLAGLSRTPSDEIYLHTTIYQLGLDSISAVQIASGLRKKGYKATAVDVLKYSSCMELATYLEHQKGSRPEQLAMIEFDSFQERILPEILTSTGTDSNSIEAIRPCTPLQKGMVSQFISSEGKLYLNYLQLELHRGIDLQKLRAAWQATTERHVMLRTGFVPVKDTKLAVAMIHYRPSSSHVPWNESPVQSLESKQWLGRIAKRAWSALHEPPWAIQVVRQDERVCLHLAIFHALFDAQSLQAIFDEVANAYNGLSSKPPPAIEPVIATIINMSSTDGAQRLQFWKSSATGAAPSRFPNLAPLRYDPQPATVMARTCSLSLSSLNSRCRQANITLQAAGIASWATILSAYTGESSVTCGVVLSGRNTEAAESVVFPCITTVPFVCKTGTDKSVLLQQIMKFSADIQEHIFLPLTDIQRLMGYPNEALFDSLFAFQKVPSDRRAGSLWKVADEQGTVDYPISIELEPSEDELVFRLTYLPHTVPKEQAAIILNQLDHFLGLFTSLDTAKRDDTVCDPTVYSITPPKQPTLPSEITLLHEFVERSAARVPDRIAFEFASSIDKETYSSDTWTYKELDTYGNQVANLLIDHGVNPGDLVAVCFEKCPEAYFAILGVLKAGAAFVALDPNAPTARKQFITADSAAKLILSLRVLSEDLAKNVQVEVLNVDETDFRMQSTNKPKLARAVDVQDRSYCLYTSGTTGTPKGCELTHENAVQAMLSFQRLFAGHWNEDSRWLQFASFHFDVSVLEQYWSWGVGICVVSAPRDLLFEDLVASIRILGITHIDLTPSLARTVHPDDVPDLCKGVFITGGESLKQEILDAWGPKGVIYNGYGPTEATIGCTMFPRVPANGKPSNIGTQFDNVGTFVLQPGTDLPVLRGGIGELCVTGKLVGKGYLKRPDLTAKSFPNLESFGERVYRTGDLVRILHDGTFEFIGRADDQVKLRGQRLEIGEINSVIKQASPALSDVATLVLKHPKQQKEQLVAFVVITGRSNEPELAKAKEACQEKLPGYMVPTHFMAIERMPLNINNKADAKRLKEMYYELSVADLQHISRSSSGSDKWTKAEEEVRDVLREMTQVEDDSIQRDSSIFELGLDSISVISFARALKQAGFTKASASLIMKNSIISRLTKAISDNSSTSGERASVIAAQQSITAAQHRHRRAVAEILMVDARDIEGLAPCTPLQQGMIARSLDSDRGLYFNTFRFKLSNAVDEGLLRNAWEEVFAATQILKTRFVNTEDGFVQAALRSARLPWISYDLAESEDLETKLNMFRRQWWKQNQAVFRKPFEVILVSALGERIFIVQIFHALYDGNSIGMLFKAVWDTYNGRRALNSAPAFQTALAHGPLRVSDGAQDFWKRHLGNNTYRPFPALDMHKSHGTTTVERHLQINGYEQIRRELNVTPQAIAQAIWANTLAKYANADLTIGMVVSGRTIDFDGIDRVLGPLFNTIPYQCSIKESATWADIIRNAHNFNVAALPYQHTPLRDITKWCKRGASNPLFDTLFVYQVGQDDYEWITNRIWELVDGGAEADYPLSMEMEQMGADSLKLTIVAQDHVLDAATAKRLLDGFECALQEALANADALASFATTDKIDAIDNRSQSPTKIRASSFGSMKDFKWTKETNIIREEVALLAEIEIGDINQTTSIFELGLDSIDGIKLSSKLKKRGVDLSVSSIMRSLTIANMANNITCRVPGKFEGRSGMVFNSHKRRLEDYLHRRGIATDDLEKILPLTPLQEAMVAEMRSSKYTKYYNHDVLELGPDVEVHKLKEAWLTVVKSSPILRTSFIEVDDPNVDFSFAQIIHQTPHTFWRSTTQDDKPDFTAYFEHMRNTVASQEATPLFHIQHIQTQLRSYLIISVAHALYDGASLGSLHADVQKAYQGRFQPRPFYEGALQEIITTSGSDAAAFWRDYLVEAKPVPFPAAHSQKNHEHQCVHRLERNSNVALRDVTMFAKKNNITMQTLGQTIYAFVLASYVESLEVTFGSVLSGRDKDSLSEVLFPTMNTVAIRTILHGTRKEMLRYAQDNFANIQEWQHFPLRRAQALAEVQGQLFDTLFIYQKRLYNGQEESQRLYESILGHSDVEYPVCVEMEVLGDQLVWRCAVKDGVLDKDGTRDLINRLDKVLGEILNRPDVPTINFEGNMTSICGLRAFKDRRQKHDNSDSSDESKEDEAAPSASLSPTAKTIREVLAFVSKTPEEEITEGMTIFHIGLDSISAIKVSSLLRKRSIILSVGEMLKAGTVEQMAHLAEQRSASVEYDQEDATMILKNALEHIDTDAIMNGAGIKSDEVESHLPASAGQIYMLSMWLNSGGMMFYPEFQYQVRSPLPFDKLATAWKDLIAKQSILRTIFAATDDKDAPYLQCALRDTGLSVIDLTDFSREEKTKVMQIAASRQPYAYLFTSKISDGWDLKLKIHHALYDGVSLPLLIQELQNACNGTTISPQPKDVHSKLLASSFASSARQKRKTFWTKYLQGIKQIDTLQPEQISRQRVEVFTPGLLSDVSSLERLSRKRGLTTQALFLATYARVYSSLMNASEIVIGIYLANRSFPVSGSESAAIPTVNLVPLRIHIHEDANIVDVAGQIQYDIQDISLFETATASLAEIFEWTGVKVATFVNFLKLPEQSKKEAETDSITIEQTSHWNDGVHRVTEMDVVGFDGTERLKSDASKAYLHAVDVEATIKNGALDVGVFAPVEMFSLEGVEKLIQNVKGELQDLMSRD